MGGYDTVIMVNPTPGGELARQLQPVLEKILAQLKSRLRSMEGYK